MKKSNKDSDSFFVAPKVGGWDCFRTCGFAKGYFVGSSIEVATAETNDKPAKLYALSISGTVSKDKPSFSSTSVSLHQVYFYYRYNPYKQMIRKLGHNYQTVSNLGLFGPLR